MKKLTALLLCLIMLTGVFAGCAKIKQNAEDKGAEIPVYISTEIYSLDPAVAYLDEAAVKILSLVYEGLFEMDEDGDVSKALCKSYTTGTNREGDFYMEITLKDTKWSDGRSVSANDFVYAWKRILEPEFTCEAASLLFDIKNARACKDGLISIDDLGVVASEARVLTITFEREIDVEGFLEYLCSPALVPLREDKASRLVDWGSYYATMVTNGPFYPRIFEPGTGMLSLERSIYYYRDTESESQKLDVYVDPYRINIYTVSPEEALKMYENGEIVLDNELPLKSRAEYADRVEIADTKSTSAYYLNLSRAPFDNADVRRALSLAIDREALCELLTYAKPAEGLIPSGIFDTSAKDDFREAGGKLIESTADVTTAKSLVSKAGATGAEFTVKVRDNAVDLAVAEFVADAWKNIGFKVTVEPVTYDKHTEIDYPQYHDQLYAAYVSGDFDVIAVDMQSMSAEAFPTLAAFSRDFSGAAMDLSGAGTDEETEELPVRDAPETTTAEAAPVDPAAPVTTALETTPPDTTAAPETSAPETTAAPETTTAAPETEAAPENREFLLSTHVTGYESDEYDALISSAFDEQDRAKRAELLHKAEEMLIGDMPVIPLFVYQDAYVKTSDLKGLKTSYFPYRNFINATLSDYERFKETKED